MGINDSKLLRDVERRELFDYILAKALAVGVSCVSPTEIDRINILEASMLAMSKAVSDLDIEPNMILIDGNRKSPYTALPQKTCVGGDRTHLAIAASSIVAKVIRDSLMVYFDGVYSGYGFAHNMGYPTFEHREALKTLGPCPIHRRKFRGVISESAQMTLFPADNEG